MRDEIDRILFSNWLAAFAFAILVVMALGDLP
jgi:hypothetical protein